MMRILPVTLLSLLFACAGPAPTPQNGTSSSLEPTANTKSPMVSTDGSMEGANTIQTPDEAVLGSTAEKAALEREAEMLADLASEGIYPETNPTQVTVKYHRAGTTIGLYNEANVSQKDYYTTARASAGYKVVPNIKMGALLKALEDLGYFEEAQSGIKHVLGSSLSVVVRRGSESYTLSWGESMGKENHELTHTCADAVRVMFDTTLSVQVVDNPAGTDFFQNERDRINHENAVNQTKRPR
ncbi:MAG: hypothetical protein ACYTEP_07570 [Planctomycetota bacterium]